MPADPQNPYDRHSGPRDRSLRVGDAEREAVSEILRREHVRGRLDADEFQERLDRSLTAKTYADLDALVADLPPEGRPRRRRAFAPTPRLWPLGIVPLVLIAVVLASGGHLLWLAFPIFALFVVRPLVWRAWGRGYRGYGPC
jgi:Domain of unknown function (DUF1707)